MLSKYVSVSLINELFLTMCICIYVYAFIFALNFETFIDACFCAPVERGWDAGHGIRGTCVCGCQKKTACRDFLLFSCHGGPGDGT